MAFCDFGDEFLWLSQMGLYLARSLVDADRTVFLDDLQAIVVPMMAGMTEAMIPHCKILKLISAFSVTARSEYERLHGQIVHTVREDHRPT